MCVEISKNQRFQARINLIAIALPGAVTVQASINALGQRVTKSVNGTLEARVQALPLASFSQNIALRIAIRCASPANSTLNTPPVAHLSPAGVCFSRSLLIPHSCRKSLPLKHIPPIRTFAAQRRPCAARKVGEWKERAPALVLPHMDQFVRP